MSFLKFTALIFFAIVCMASCENIENQNEENSQNQNLENTFFGNKTYQFPLISPEAINYVSDWAVFEDFRTEAFEINGNNINQLKAGSERLVARVDSLIKKIPDTLDTQQIYSRVLVVKTRASLLFQEVNRVEVDSISVQQHISEMNIATSNLITQINGKFEKDAIDFERTDNEKKELELQKKKADSIFKAELKDNQN
ncbi:hypothetical protein [Patiriisocius marinistellae]|nr:hypothetical protein [Patiriisocius marinistellae]